MFKEWRSIEIEDIIFESGKTLTIDVRFSQDGR
jgi:hypothetical protein